ncbi:beta-keratin-related keratin-like [Podarcis lilfordi]|uniref:Beta-keratin-related keratin-like n=1 Tax=Podarcis lilfordi TaxID=74358 RepID=A0AA35LMB5_9SAUR|nr:beta-keratin-related keratin-like [Podarcis lilfordi]
MANRNAAGHNECYAQCPASTVTIQPPPFILNIPGPALYCPDQPLAIEQSNPCVGAGGGYGGGNHSLYATGGSNLCHLYSRALPSSNYSYCCYRY